MKKDTNVFVTIKLTVNNIFVTVVSITGDVLFWVSSGTCGFKGSRKVTTLAAETIAILVAKRLISWGLINIEFKIHSLLNNKLKTILKSFLSFSKITVVSVNLEVPISHNGIRSKKKRRV